MAGRRRSVRHPFDVLVVGAGPTGLALALQAHDHGANVRVVERRPEAFRQSRAMILHPRTLETLRPLAVTDELLGRADIAPRAELHLGRSTVTAHLAELDLPDTSFPHLTLLRQMDVEEVLADALRSRGVQVERGTELVDASSEPDEGGLVQSTLRTGAGAEDAASRFIAGCDGAGSTVRKLAGIGWRGGSYREEVVLADVELGGSLTPGVLHVAAGRGGLVFVFALGEGATWRVLATRRRGTGDEPHGQSGRPVPAVEVQRLIDAAGLGASVTELKWSVHVPLQHRLAQSYRCGRFFLAGDAAHVHSPAAAQGMNTGIVDAVNLGWKLAFASAGLDSGEPSDLLASYEQERRPVARQVLALTHLVFFAEASTSPLAALLRGRLVPLAAPVLPYVLRQRRPMAAVVEMLSQRWVRYRHSVLSIDGTPAHHGWPRPGDRLPDADVMHDGRVVRLHALTARPGLHILLQRDAANLDLHPLGPHVWLHRINSSPGHGIAAVRPDGHVGFRCGQADPAQLRCWLDLVGAH